VEHELLARAEVGGIARRLCHHQLAVAMCGVEQFGSAAADVFFHFDAGFECLYRLLQGHFLAFQYLYDEYDPAPDNVRSRGRGREYDCTARSVSGIISRRANPSESLMPIFSYTPSISTLAAVSPALMVTVLERIL